MIVCSVTSPRVTSAAKSGQVITGTMNVFVTYAVVMNLIHFCNDFLTGNPQMQEIMNVYCILTTHATVLLCSGNACNCHCIWAHVGLQFMYANLTGVLS